MKFKHLLLSFSIALVASLPAHALGLPTCAAMAANEFGVPEKVFKAIALHAKDEPAAKATIAGGIFGPMRLAGSAIDRIAPALKVEASTIKTDACQNYRAAAWWLAVPAGGRGASDIWGAVNTYYYGRAKMKRYQVTEEVKTIYSAL